MDKIKVRDTRKTVRNIRFPSEMWRQLQDTAEKNHRTAAQQALLYIEEGLKNEKEMH